ncbi:MAG: hypothetical protein K2I83_04515, partial [Bacteroidales bacterium]|nr:hypothetical protein [Bacteroidales bacterium]
YRIDAYIPDRNAISAYLHNPVNAFFYEYFLAVCLSNKDAYMINAEWNKIRQFYPRHVPRHLQEAVLATYGYAPARYLYPKKIEGIEAETWNDYWAFIIDDQAYRNNRITIDELEHKWRHTFWFYQLYIIREFS